MEGSEKGFKDNFGFYVADMTGKQWLTTIGELGSSVWENAALPENYWNEDKGSKTNKVRMPPLFTGVSDGVIGEVTEYPQLVKLGYDVSTNSELRDNLWNSVANISFGSVRKLATDAVKEEIDGWNFTDKPWEGYHKVGQKGVQVASLAFGGFIKKVQKQHWKMALKKQVKSLYIK